MPSLIRFLVLCAVLAGCVYGAMFALATFVEPNPREMTVRIPNDKLDLQQ
ncbi:MAG: histidine kinase [Nitratireductor sp.]|nr:histidine kinase [Nitratireductor sp.]